MARINNFEFTAGRAPVTSSIQIALAHKGSRAAHTQAPYSEALLSGIAGGICFAYFTFAYEGQNPQVNIITRNSFNNYGWDAIISALGIHQNVQTSATEEKAFEKLVAALEQGQLPIVFADVFTLGYEHSEFNGDYWAMQPMVVFGYTSEGNTVQTVDRSSVAHSFSADLLGQARSRVKKERNRMIILSEPDSSLLESAVREGIRTTVALFSEKPPKGSARNFGFKGYEALISDLRSTSAKGWRTRFAQRSAQFSALFTAYKYSLHFWKRFGEGGDRLLYSDFLKEAAEILPSNCTSALKSAEEAFRESAAAWNELGGILLPDSVPALARLRELINSRQKLFNERGIAAREELQSIDSQLQGCIQGSPSAPPAENLSPENLSPETINSILDQTAEHFATISRIEQKAIHELSAVVHS